jgi:transposase-like protein
VAGVVGRESGQIRLKQIRLKVCRHSDRDTLEPFVLEKTGGTATVNTDDATVNTDEWKAYGHLPETGRSHPTVCHAPGTREWAREDDGDGIRELHCNTIEGIWTGLRNFLRPFRGVSKRYLGQYVAVFEAIHNLKQVSSTLLRALLIPPLTLKPT